MLPQRNIQCRAQLTLNVGKHSNLWTLPNWPNFPLICLMLPNFHFNFNLNFKIYHLTNLFFTFDKFLPKFRVFKIRFGFSERLAKLARPARLRLIKPLLTHNTCKLIKFLNVNFIVTNLSRTLFDVAGIKVKLSCWTFIINLTISIYISFSNHFLHFFICQLLTQVRHHMSQLCCTNKTISILQKNHHNRE